MKWENFTSLNNINIVLSIIGSRKQNTGPKSTNSNFLFIHSQTNMTPRTHGLLHFVNWNQGINLRQIVTKLSCNNISSTPNLGCLKPSLNLRIIQAIGTSRSATTTFEDSPTYTSSFHWFFFLLMSDVHTIPLAEGYAL